MLSNSILDQWKSNGWQCVETAFITFSRVNTNNELEKIVIKPDDELFWSNFMSQSGRAFSRIITFKELDLINKTIKEIKDYERI